MFSVSFHFSHSFCLSLYLFTLVFFLFRRRNLQFSFPLNCWFFSLSILIWFFYFLRKKLCLRLIFKSSGSTFNGDDDASSRILNDFNDHFNQSREWILSMKRLTTSFFVCVYLFIDLVFVCLFALCELLLMLDVRFSWFVCTSPFSIAWNRVCNI